MSVVEAYYRQNREYVLGYRFKESGNNVLSLKEEAGEAIEAYNDIWIAAVEFFTQERDDLVDLPPDSSERMFVEGMLGILRQHELDKGNTVLNADDVRAEAQRVAASLDDIREGANENMRTYVDKLINGMRELHNRIDPESAITTSEEPIKGKGTEEEPSGSSEAEGAEGEEGEKEEEEEELPEPENPESIAKVLGL